MREKNSLQWLALLASALMLSGCGNTVSAEDFPTPNKATPTNEQVPTLIVKEEEKTPSPDFSEAQPNDSCDDLVTMTSEEASGFALFCGIMSETQFRDMLQGDGADFVPNRLAQFENRYLAYYNSDSNGLIICDYGLHWFRSVIAACELAESKIQDAQWLNENCLLILGGNESSQSIYTYLMTEQTLTAVYTAPADKAILEMTITEDGKVECTIGARSALMTSAPEEIEAQGEENLPASNSDTEGAIIDSAIVPPEEQTEKVLVIFP